MTGTQQEVADFVRHHESQQHPGVALIPLRKGLNRLVVGVCHIAVAGVGDECFTHDVEGRWADGPRGLVAPQPNHEPGLERL